MVNISILQGIKLISSMILKAVAAAYKKTERF